MANMANNPGKDPQKAGDTGQTDSEDMDNYDTQRSSDAGLDDDIE